MERPKIGELLVAAGVIEPDVLESALEKQRAQGGRLGMILIEMGALDEEMLVRTVARQLDMPVAWLRGKQVKAEVLAQLPKHIALKHRCLPVMIDRKGPETLLVAMEDPSDAAALDEVAVAAGRPIRVVLAAPSDLDDALERHFPKSQEAEPAEEEEEPELLLTDPLGETGPTEPELRRASREAEPSPAAALDPLDLGGQYDPIARSDDTPALDLGPDPDVGRQLDPADLGAEADLGVGADLAPRAELEEPAPDLATDLAADAAPGASASDDGDDLGLDLDADASALRAGDSLDDAIDEVRGAGADLPRERNPELASGDEAPSLFGDDPLEATLPPRPARGDALPRDTELRAIVELLIERGLLSREEVAARLQAPGHDDRLDG